MVQKIYSIIITLSLILFLTHCKAPGVMPNHAFTYQTLKTYPVDSTVYTSDFTNKTIILEVYETTIINPIGSYLNDNYSADGNPIEQTLVLDKPGYVLYEKIAQELTNSNATICRKYFQDALIPEGSCPNSHVIKISVKELEVHIHEKKSKEVFSTGRTRINFKIDDKKIQTIELSTKIKTKEDIFAHLAKQFNTKLLAELNK